MNATLPSNRTNLLQRWNALPLYLRILIAMIAGAVAGLLLGERAT